MHCPVPTQFVCPVLTQFVCGGHFSVYGWAPSGSHWRPVCWWVPCGSQGRHIWSVSPVCINHGNRFSPMRTSEPGLRSKERGIVSMRPPACCRRRPNRGWQASVAMLITTQPVKDTTLLHPWVCFVARQVWRNL